MHCLAEWFFALLTSSQSFLRTFTTLRGCLQRVSIRSIFALCLTRFLNDLNTAHRTVIGLPDEIPLVQGRAAINACTSAGLPERQPLPVQALP